MSFPLDYQARMLLTAIGAEVKWVAHIRVQKSNHRRLSALSRDVINMNSNLAIRVDGGVNLLNLHEIRCVALRDYLLFDRLTEDDWKAIEQMA